MQKALSKITKKYQATIPAIVREKLHLSAGDTISFEVQGSNIIIHKATPLDIAFISALNDTLSEWNSPEDEEAFRDL